ncbi:hypothetical protein NLM33_37305 [Bradyrhizobium sp. CCGUVB1N3]|uniref:hypothetical protein n=1 Tax=Bradyrhizobium sp. CCGUVB1N3 TaxID=2949629 RepID=UPI0020B3AD3B|nr:hypothetical protein [Bradyrhizobium sp. CCGUVB1N3]MCP3475902.1 hypothetical protein [Bradyrhizobium sp. CCGUVB1N3]
MKFLPNSADIPHDLIRSVSDGDVIFLCGAGVSLGVGLPTFKKLTDDGTPHAVVVTREVEGFRSHSISGR